MASPYDPALERQISTPAMDSDIRFAMHGTACGQFRLGLEGERKDRDTVFAVSASILQHLLPPASPAGKGVNCRSQFFTE
jgi:hypothetical protein